MGVWRDRENEEISFHCEQLPAGTNAIDAARRKARVDSQNTVMETEMKGNLSSLTCVVVAAVVYAAVIVVVVVVCVSALVAHHPLNN